ncbi:hypothetical protein [Traorella massiliensis]|uniref:hypothetical protein n=1 Tax=Traorella massiliensis TaxID=1903263 RepID=UPI002353DED3|nr:hypothetical protein [Traorella massiliensis]
MNEYPKAINKIAISYLIFFISINLGTLDCVPDWIGYWMIYNSLEIIAIYEKSVKLLKPLTIILIAYELIIWLISAFGIVFDNYSISVLFAALSLYFHYQLLTNLADIAQSHQCKQAKRIRQLRDVRTILSTIIVFPILWNTEIMIIYIAIALIISIWLMRTLYTYSFDERMLVKQCQINTAMEN